MSLEKNKADKNEKKEESVKPLHQKVADWMSKEWRKSAVVGAGLLALGSTPTFGQNQENDFGTVNYGYDKKEIKETPSKISQEKQDKIYSKTYTELISGKALDASHGDFTENLENRKAGVEKNVFNSFKNILDNIEKNGKENVYYKPHAVGEASPYWHQKKGDVVINNLEDYKKHVEENLSPNGFKGETFSNIEHFGFKLKEDEFITDLKSDHVVKAGVIGGKAYVLLKKGTPMVLRRAISEKTGLPCNIYTYILACMNPVLADEPFTTPDGAGNFSTN